MTIDFRSIRAVALDMDGVLWRGGQPLPGVREFFTFLQAQAIPYALATNNSTTSVEDYVTKLADAGVPATPAQIITSAVATAEYVRRHYPPDTPIYIVGETGLHQTFAANGFRFDPDAARLVIAGLDRALTYEKIMIAAMRIRAGADFIGTNPDRTFPVPEGLIPGAGTVLAAIQAATDVAPLVIGKPEPTMFEVAVEHLGATPDTTLMIGDRLDTDILGAAQAGLRTALVLTGITTANEARASNIRADGVFDDLPALHAAWQASLALND
ncbi:MAG: HAD-IIA family hydrolase [Chloroflexi bacterium]|nr:HAD-IIA family hydrolase [Chloroflexota bacterium]